MKFETPRQTFKLSPSHFNLSCPLPGVRAEEGWRPGEAPVGSCKTAPYRRILAQPRQSPYAQPYRHPGRPCDGRIR